MQGCEQKDNTLLSGVYAPLQTPTSKLCNQTLISKTFDSVCSGCDFQGTSEPLTLLYETSPVLTGLHISLHSLRRELRRFDSFILAIM